MYDENGPARRCPGGRFAGNGGRIRTCDLGVMSSPRAVSPVTTGCLTTGQYRWWHRAVRLVSSDALGCAASRYRRRYQSTVPTLPVRPAVVGDRSEQRAINRCRQAPDLIVASRGPLTFAEWCPSAPRCCSLRSQLRSLQSRRSTVMIKSGSFAVQIKSASSRRLAPCQPR